jgi:nucleoside-diphosphate-sugar epimerase
VIPAIITQALTGDVIKLGNLKARRDFTYLTDTVKGFIKVAETEGIDGEVFNLGTGIDITIADLTKEIIQLVGRPLAIETEYLITVKRSKYWAGNHRCIFRTDCNRPLPGLSSTLISIALGDMNFRIQFLFRRKM